jgi:transglutaminase-like putative cysteine protease
MIPTVATFGALGRGDAGTMDDLNHMARLVGQSIKSPMVIYQARQIARLAGERNYRAQAIGIRDFLRSVWRFVDDPRYDELLRDGEHMLRELNETGFITGDCDESAVLGAALGEAIGIEAELVALAFDPDQGGNGEYSHVYAQLLTPEGECISLDVTRPAGLVPYPSRTLVVGFNPL